MSMTQSVIGIGGLAVGLHMSIQALAPDPAFMTVDRLEQVAPNEIVFSRTVNTDMVADYAVVVSPVDDRDAVLCDGYGRAEYLKGENPKKTWTLDYTANDPGCWDRLPSGDANVRVFWVPVDKSDAVIRDFTVTKP